MRHAHSFAAVLALLFSATASGEGTSLQQKRFAVLEFRSEGTPARSLGLLSDEVRGALASVVKARGALVLTRENMLEVTRVSGGKCVEGECELETARNLNVHWFVAGDLANLEGRWVLSMKLYETRQGSLLAARRLMSATELELLDRVAPVAIELLRTIPGQAEPRAAAGQDWRESQSLVPAGSRPVIRFESIPPGAVVRLDGALLCQGTPCSKAVEVGAHEVLMEAERHAPRTESVEVTAESRMVRLELTPRFGWLSVDTGAADAPILLDGRLVGRRRVEALEQDPGSHLLAVQDPCWLTVREQVTVNAGTLTQRSLKTERRAVLVDFSAVDARDNDLMGAVEVDGTMLGRFPGQHRVPVCSSTARLVLDDGRAATQSLSLGTDVSGQAVRLRVIEGDRRPLSEESRPVVTARKDGNSNPWWTVAAIGGGSAVLLGGATVGIRAQLTALPAGDSSVGPLMATGTVTQVAAIGALVTAVTSVVVALVSN